MLFLSGNGTAAGAGFGRSVSFDGVNVVVGAPGFSFAGKRYLTETTRGTSVGAVFNFSGVDFMTESIIEPVPGESDFGASTRADSIS